MSRAAAAPWTTRAITRKVALGARPQAAEARVNRLRPMTYSRRLPYRSPSLPAVISPAASARPYPATMNWIAEGLACKVRWVSGRATLTMKKSSREIKVPASKTGSAARAGPASCLVSGGATVEVITCSSIS